MALHTHLRHVRSNQLTARTVCGIAAWQWTDDVNAVTCPSCITRTELQPA